MPTEIERELERIVGGGGGAVRVSPIETPETANRRVRLETAEAAYDLPANELLLVLRNLKDGIGINPLRQAIEQRFASPTER